MLYGGTKMINYNEACALAFDYYKNKVQVIGLVQAYECAHSYIFCGGKKNIVSIGSFIIAVSKKNGNISILKFPSKENSELIKNATPLDIPNVFLSK